MNSPILRVMVTASGGDLGQAIVKALRLGTFRVSIIGCDCDEAGIGEVFVDDFCRVPPANRADEYIGELDAICRRVGAQAVIPASEAEIALCSKQGSPARLPCGVPLICLDRTWVDTYGDKLKCMQALDGKLPLVRFADGRDSHAVQKLVDDVGLPLVVKARRASGSRTLRIARSTADLTKYLQEIDSPLVQEFMEPYEGEFSVGMFRGSGFESVINFRRELGQQGCSWYAETSDDRDVLEYASAAMRLTGLRGSANLQARKTPAGVRLLEINPRFSSLVAARTACGFRDVEWSLCEALGLKIDPPAPSYRSLRFRRFFHEVVDFGEGYCALQKWLPIKTKDQT